MKFSSPQEFVDYVKYQINVDIKLIKIVKPRKKIYYMEIPDKTLVWSLLYKAGLRIDKHLNDCYYVYL